MLIKAAVELTTQEAPQWEMIAARLLMLDFEQKLEKNMRRCHIECFYDKLAYLTEQGLYGDYILKAYDRDEIERLALFIEPKRNHLFTYSGLNCCLADM
mgnify:FL=1